MLPKIDTPVYELTLPVSKKPVKYRPFLVKEQKNLLMAMEADDKESIERNVKQILHNCTLTQSISIEELPVVDVEYYFLQLRAKSVGEIVENKYICNNEVNGTACGNSMLVKFDINDIKVEQDSNSSDIINVTDKISIKMQYPKFSTMENLKNSTTSVDMAFKIVADSIEYIFDGDQYYYANEADPKELVEFIESLNSEQFTKLEEFFKNLPKIKKELNFTCSKCGFQHHIDVEGLENFFG